MSASNPMWGTDAWGIPARLTDGAALENALPLEGAEISGRGGTGRRWRLKIRSKIQADNDLAPGEGPLRGGPDRFVVRSVQHFSNLDEALARGEALWEDDKTTAVQVLIDDDTLVWEKQRA